MGDAHFANISHEFRVFLLNVYCLFCLTGNWRLFLVYNIELINIGEWMAFGVTMLVYGRVGSFLAIVMSDNFHHFLDEINFQCLDPLLNPCARKLNTKCKVLPFIVV